MLIPAGHTSVCSQLPLGWVDRRFKLEPDESGQQLEQELPGLPSVESQQQPAPQLQPQSLLLAEHTAAREGTIQGPGSSLGSRIRTVIAEPPIECPIVGRCRA